MHSVREARRLHRKGRDTEALVHLWNALEPARLDSDLDRLAQIHNLAAAVAADGDPNDQPEAARLVAVARAAIEEGAALADEAITGTVEVGGQTMQDFSFEPPRPEDFTAEPVPAGAPGRERYDDPGAEEEEQQQQGRGTSIFWLVLVLGFIVINILRNIE